MPSRPLPAKSHSLRAGVQPQESQTNQRGWVTGRSQNIEHAMAGEADSGRGSAEDEPEMRSSPGMDGDMESRLNANDGMQPLLGCQTILQYLKE